MSKLSRKEFKDLLNEWTTNFISENENNSLLKEFVKTNLSSNSKQKYYFDAIKGQLKKSDGGGGGGGNNEFQKRRGGGGGGRIIYATWWHDMIRLSLLSPEENELDAESKDYVDPSIKDPSHFFFDQKKYTDYLKNQGNLNRNYHDIMIDLQLKAIHDIVSISKKGNINDNNWYMQLHFPELPYDKFLSFKLEDALIDLSSHKADNILDIRFIPKSKEMLELIKRGEGIFGIFSKNKHEIIIDSIDCRNKILSSPRFYMSTMSNFLEGINPFNFSTNSLEDVEAVYEALSFIIEECDLSYDLNVEVIQKGYNSQYEGYSSQYEDELDDFQESNRKLLEKNLNLLFKTLKGHK